MLQKLRVISCLSIAILVGSSLSAQHGYDASWKAGLLGVSQNPASIATAPYRGEFLLGSIDLTARNNLFETNEIDQFFPTKLLNNLFKGPDSLLFVSDVNQDGFLANDAMSWNSSNISKILGPSAFWRLKSNPDLVEKGIVRRLMSLRLERFELTQISDMNAEFGKAYAARFSPQVDGLSVRDDHWVIQRQEWDALAVGLAVSLGRGINLLHFSLGGKLLSAGSYMRLEGYGTQFDFRGNNTLQLQADSITFAYNPGFENSLFPLQRRRYGYFENSWGLAGEFGFIFQKISPANRKPTFEFGLSIQDLGSIRFWNLKNRKYELPDQLTNYNTFNLGQGSIPNINNVFAGLAKIEEEKAEGITETLPLLITAHTKFNLGKNGWAFQIRSNFRRDAIASSWQTLLRTTLSYEKQKVSMFFPLSSTLVLPSTEAIELRPRLGFFMALSDKYILGSNDVLTTLFFSSTRSGVAATHFFIAAHFPIKRDL